MNVERVRQMCLELKGATEDVKWGSDLVFSVGGKMFAVVCLDPPHTMAFKCTAEMFAELVEREGIRPAPYLARAMWVQERAVGDVLDRGELNDLIRKSYELVVATLPRTRRPDGQPSPSVRGARRSRRGPSRSRRRRS